MTCTEPSEPSIHSSQTIADQQIVSQLKEEVSKLHSESATLRTSKKQLSEKAVALEKSLNKV